jgi:mannose-6-phosphate isomerase
MLYPLKFEPRFKDRIWGGRELERLYGKHLPAGQRIGESWEISDRPDDASVIANGPLAGEDLRWLMERHGAEVLGTAQPAASGRFPLLCKILDAREKLSLQVHPPANKADELNGEPKTEMWYIADAAPDATLYVGLKRGMTREQFAAKITDGSVAECFHCLPVRAGDAMFLPSGRVHAIGAGLVIFEIQQNSDTTYRVFDWNRLGLDGKPRELHVAQSMASIDFEDFEPQRAPSGFWTEGGVRHRPLVNDPLFQVEEWQLEAGTTTALKARRLQIVAVTTRTVAVRSGATTVELRAGEFALVPASLEQTEIAAPAGAGLLWVEAN